MKNHSIHQRIFLPPNILPTTMILLSPPPFLSLKHIRRQPSHQHLNILFKLCIPLLAILPLVLFPEIPIIDLMHFPINLLTYFLFLHLQVGQFCLLGLFVRLEQDVYLVLLVFEVLDTLFEGQVLAGELLDVTD